jgi:parallel beta-helix repeat protein
MYSDVTDLINQYDSSIDIVYSDREFQNLIQKKYCKVLYWPRDFEANTSYLIINNNNMLGYNTIQEAINSFATYQGDSLLVKPGTYQENIVITKPVTLTSQNSSTTIIDGSGSGTVLTIATDNVTINGFTLQNSDSLGAGILLENAHNCRVINNTVINNYEGIVLDNSSGNVLKENNIYHNSYNLVLKNSSQNDIDTSNKVDGKPYTSG